MSGRLDSLRPGLVPRGAVADVAAEADREAHRPTLSSPALRILVVAQAMPFPPVWGSGLRNYQLLRYLSRHHEVTFLTYRTSEDPSATEVLGGICSRAIYVPPPFAGEAKRRRQLASAVSRHSYHASSNFSESLQDALDRELTERTYDIIQIEQSTMSRFRVNGGHAVTVLDEHNIEFESLYRSAKAERSPLRKLYNYGEYRKHRREEIGAWRRASGCTVTSAREEAILRGLVPGKPVAVVMNSVDTTYFRPSGARPDPNELVFTGLMSYRPNVDAVTHFVRVILPLIRRARPNVRLSIVGAGPSREVLRLSSDFVHVTGGVPDVRPFLERAAVVVVPIRSGGGTRFKVAEGLAMGKAVVATTIGAEGIGVRHEEQILLADDATAFAGSVLRALADERLARALGTEGRRFAEAHLSWSAAGERLVGFYGQLREPATIGGAATIGRDREFVVPVR